MYYCCFQNKVFFISSLDICQKFGNNALGNIIYLLTIVCVLAIRHCACLHFFVVVFYSYHHLHQTLTLAEVSMDRTWCHHLDGMYNKSPGNKMHSLHGGDSSKNNGYFSFILVLAVLSP
jgi:hypothetical protein